METVYLVMERMFFYTDEVFIPLDGDSLDHAEHPEICNSPQKLFLDSDTAQAYAHKLNVRQFAGMRPSDFALAPDEIGSCSERELFHRLKAILGDEIDDKTDWSDLIIPVDISDEQLEQVADLFQFVRYIVIEAQMDTEELRQHLVTIIGDEIACYPEMRAFTLPSRLSLNELRYIARSFHLGWISLDGEDALLVTD